MPTVPWSTKGPQNGTTAAAFGSGQSLQIVSDRSSDQVAHQGRLSR
jgi:hypothetical protein